MNRIVAAIASLAAAAALAQQIEMPKDLQAPPSERWFSITRSSAGFLAGGNLGGTLWAFHVRGQDFKWLGKGNPPLFAIDGVVMQVKVVNRRLVTMTGPSILREHKRFEQDYQARNNKGVTFHETDICRNAKIAHQQWIEQAPAAPGKPGIAQAYVTFEVGDYILRVVAPYENDVRKQAVERVMDDVCSSFLREKVGA